MGRDTRSPSSAASNIFSKELQFTIYFVRVHHCQILWHCELSHPKPCRLDFARDLTIYFTRTVRSLIEWQYLFFSGYDRNLMMTALSNVLEHRVTNNDTRLNEITVKDHKADRHGASVVRDFRTRISTRDSFTAPDLPDALNSIFLVLANIQEPPIEQSTVSDAT
ncbi:uncharacterized protein [Venturia canescens]|uniref:uncharacterized protein n=1 Tax=Venturia canescens TaxID=32260 RepID=UPI001C9CF22A|nr:uncharacterized protein LOC122412384 [Venturia canescens]XP_043277793.1 uncharacterized protein LOC122412384 [Venturia canescens]